MKYFGVYISYSNDLIWNNYFYFEELNDCIDALSFLKKASLDTTSQQTHFKEIIYLSREGHKFGILQDSKNQTFYLNFNVPNENINYPLKIIDELMLLFTNGKSFLSNTYNL